MNIDASAMEVQPIDALSTFLLDLYRLAETSPLDEFRPRAFERLKQLIPFDSGWWGAGVSTPGCRFVAHAALHELPDSFTDDYADVMSVDHTSHELQRRPGRSLAFNGAIAEDPHPVKLFDRKYGLHSCLSTHPSERSSGVYQFISTFRRQRSGPYSEREREWLDHVRPHLAQAWSINWRSSVRAEPADGVAVTDPSGRVVDANPQFLEMIRVRFPAWAGGTLPSCLTRTARPVHRHGPGVVAAAGPRPARAEHRIVTLTHGPAPRPGLAPRELEVAVAYASGRSHKDIAQRLCLSPTTVRTYLQRSYERLGVSNKMALRASLERQGADVP